MCKKIDLYEFKINLYIIKKFILNNLGENLCLCVV